MGILYFSIVLGLVVEAVQGKMQALREGQGLTLSVSSSTLCQGLTLSVSSCFQLNFVSLCPPFVPVCPRTHWIYPTCPLKDAEVKLDINKF